MCNGKINKSSNFFFFFNLFNKLNFILFIIILALNKIKSDTITNGGSYPLAYTLINGNQIFIGENAITLYDADFQNSLNQYNLTEDLKVSNLDESIKTTFCQFKQSDGGYILLLIKDNLLLFDSTLKMIHKISDISDKLGQTFYDLVPYKKVNDDLYYVIVYSIPNSSNYQIVILYYKINILTGDNIEINILNHEVTSLTGQVKSLSGHSKIPSCQYMSYTEDIIYNYLTCFFTIRYPDEFNTISFDLEKNLSLVSNKKTYFNQTIQYTENVRSTKLTDSKSFVCYSREYDKCVCFYYDLILNSFTAETVYINDCRGGNIGMNVKYYKSTNEILISCRNQKEYYMTILSPDLDIINNNSIFNFPDDNTNRYSVVYSPKQSKYLLIYNYNSESYHENIDCLGNKTEVIFDEIIKEGEEEIEEVLKEEKEEKIEEELIEQKEERKIFEEFEEEILKEELEELIEETQSVEAEKIKGITPIIINCEKCSECTQESWNLNLCISCNEEKNYKAVDFGTHNPFPSPYVECYNSKTKPENFFYNKNTNKYQPCYETCATCSKEGNENIHNCDLCAVDFIKKPDTPGTTNCVPKCDNYYYFNSVGQYKCTKNKICPDEAKYLIKNKGKCIKDCILDDIYIFEYSGRCYANCPENTVSNVNKICEIKDKNKCSLDENNLEMKGDMDTEINTIVKNYLKSYDNTNKHISSYQNSKYYIIIYKSQNCVEELGINLPKIDFGDCYEKIQKNYKITDELITIIINKQNENTISSISFAFYNPISGDKLNANNICKDSKITVQENLLNLLNNADIDISIITSLTDQNINIFNQSDEFYTDICYHFDSPSENDVALKDRLQEYYPNITLCEEGCSIKGVNLINMTSICECIFSNLLNNDLLKENALYATKVREVVDIINSINIAVLKCYKDVFNMKLFKKNIGGFIIIGFFIIESILVIIYRVVHINSIIKFVSVFTDRYVDYLSKNNPNKNNINNNQNGSNNKNMINDSNNSYETDHQEGNPVKKQNPFTKRINKNKKNEENQISQQTNTKITSDCIRLVNKSKTNKTSNLQKIKIGKMRKDNSYKTERQINFKPRRIKNFNKNEDINKNMSKIKITIIKSLLEINPNDEKNIIGYLSTDVNDLDYDDAIKKDKRSFCEFFHDKIIDNIVIINTFYSDNCLKPRSIKLILFLINIDLYFVINGLFFNEDYVSKVYHLKKPDEFFSFLSRSFNRFVYTSITGLIFRYFIGCFVFDEGKLKRIYKREKNDIMSLRYEISLIIKNIKNRYTTLIIVCYLITAMSWYYITCFNNVYPHMVAEWIKSSIFIFFIMQIIRLLAVLIGGILRFMSFECKSEKLFKFSKMLC